jgi:hypothetical protein
MKKKQKPVSLLYVGADTAEYMKAQATAINQKHGANVGLATIARAVMNGLCEARLNLDSARGEHDITDIIVRKLGTAPTPEAK